MRSLSTLDAEAIIATSAALARYPDYCGEMFSLTGKLTALDSMQLDDPAVISAVNDIETLTTGLSRKVWKKIVLLHSRQTNADEVWIATRR